MRFLPHEHQAFTALLAKHGIDAGDVLFVKRRGRLHVQCPGRSDTFAFFRAKRTTLDAEGRWQERTAYAIGAGRTEAMRTWGDVLHAFEAWLQQRP